MGEWLTGQKIADASALKKIEDEAREEMKAAVEFAIAAPYPGVEEVDQDVYA
jgi:TPP-dependent pyruvate/acetoin dehydrogenase alpha subunit